MQGEAISRIDYAIGEASELVKCDGYYGSLRKSWRTDILGFDIVRCFKLFRSRMLKSMSSDESERALDRLLSMHE